MIFLLRSAFLCSLKCAQYFCDGKNKGSASTGRETSSGQRPRTLPLADCPRGNGPTEAQQLSAPGVTEAAGTDRQAPQSTRDGTGTLKTPLAAPRQKPEAPTGRGVGRPGRTLLHPGGRHTGLAQVRKPLLISHHTQQGSRCWADSCLARAWRMTDAATLAPAGVMLCKHQVLADTRGCADVLCNPSV